MAIANNLVQTLTCDGPGCDRSVTFAQSEAAEVMKNTPWLKTARIVSVMIKENPQSPDKSFLYCCDVCEVSGVATQKHNFEEKKLIEMPTGDQLAKIRAAAQAAEATRQGDKALREGTATIQPATH